MPPCQHDSPLRAWAPFVLGWWICVLLLARTEGAASTGNVAETGWHSGWNVSSRVEDDAMMTESTCPRELSVSIVMICHARPKLLQEALNSLLSVRGVSPNMIVAVQDGTQIEVERVVQAAGIHLVQNSNNPECCKPHLPDRKAHIARADKISRHFKFALESAFKHFKQADALIVAEDDLLFSPDWLEYFLLAASVVDSDKSLWSASAWNDNGRQSLVREPHKVFRTDHFPGLSWLLLRDEWIQLRSEWPTGHWDWGMRDNARSQGRHVLVPEVPRVYHAGEVGTFSDPVLHSKYFSQIANNCDLSFRWRVEDLQAGRKAEYDARIISKLSHGAVHIRHGGELMGALGYLPGITLVVWYRSNPDPRFEKDFRPLAEELGIWHEQLRGACQGLHEIRYKNSLLFLINLFHSQHTRKPKRAAWFHGMHDPTPWASYRPVGSRIFRSGKEIAEEMRQASQEGAHT
mmetsp:Transcript_11268/g.20830  ORF Transcript_11268/g.20830 Transcript_11268/m.20830 type:complete len:462 (-) Transcript_11268:266-1651(-)